ncbi:hypothetical protein C5Y96_17175 [Blastopirellula marina]|uniref:Band 7 domain-containing protein n=1 Tax=Blastopirellula marina TaxID=124 RepID=A0A2S8F554_9BACT|nr:MULTISPECIES: protease modulator HflK [Pirellulaceae]PQO27277.1 hypothetical protein C5Y96_17175 [Blastopirellula marina]RCS47814.1 protease modulator HflK [Bremerella cremea]
MSGQRDFPLPPPPKESRSRRTEQIGAGVGAGMRIIGLLAALLIILFWCSGITMVQPNEVALLTRFGKLVGDTPGDHVQPPGILLALPYPIDEVIRIPVKEEREVAIDRLQLGAASNNATALDPIRDGYVLCGDQHILQTNVRVKYRISDPVAFHFQADRPEHILKEAAAASIVQTIAGWNAMDTLRLQRSTRAEEVERLPIAVRDSLQQRLDQLGIGIQVSAVEFREIIPTPQLAEAFENVQSEQIHIETRKREAEGFAARTLPKAEADRYTLVNEATRFQTDVTTKADEEVTLFDKVYAQYLANPELVWSRLYLEAMEQIMQSVGRLKFVAPGTRIVISPKSSLEKSPSVVSNPAKEQGP